MNYYELLGERVNVDSFANMVRSVARKLYDLDGSIIEQMALKQEVLPGGWQIPVFAYDGSVLRKPVKLKKDADIFISTGFSASDCISFIRGLLMKYDLDLEEDFLYSARPNSGNEQELNRLNVAKNWCEARKAEAKIEYDPQNSQRRYVRFTTPTMNRLIPESPDKLSPWKTRNFYFYEITEYKGELFIQLYFYCRNISGEMKSAFSHLAEIMNRGDLTKGYKLYFKSTAFKNNDEDTVETVLKELDVMLEEVMAFEAQVLEKWDS